MENQISKMLDDQNCQHGINPQVWECLLCKLEDKVATEIDIIKGFNVETQKGFNRLSERIEKLESMDKACTSDHIEKYKEISELQSDVGDLKDKLADVLIDLQEAHRIIEVHGQVVRSERLSPYKCPNCNGQGVISTILTPGQCKQCPSCKGNGCLWEAVRNPEQEFKEARPAKDIGMNFGEAIDAMRRGYKISRWHRDDIYVWLREACGDLQACLMVRTVNDELYPWTPNQQEILATNWRIIE